MVAGLAGCGGTKKDADKTTEINVGYFNNVTHAQALYMKAQRTLDKAFDGKAKVKWTSFNAGPSEVEALFSGDIESNLKYGYKDATEEDLKESTEIAQATEFISSKPDGFKTEISQGGTNVSGGQKQRLSIARALVKKPEIYIFDDSFSALDLKTDAALRKALSKKTKNSTILLVAQRVSTIINADQIVVMDEGKVAGIGTHNELMKNCEVYKQIALSQLSKEELANE